MRSIHYLYVFAHPHINNKKRLGRGTAQTLSTWTKNVSIISQWPQTKASTGTGAIEWKLDYLLAYSLSYLVDNRFGCLKKTVKKAFVLNILNEGLVWQTNIQDFFFFSCFDCRSLVLLFVCVDNVCGLRTVWMWVWVCLCGWMALPNHFPVHRVLSATKRDWSGQESVRTATSTFTSQWRKKARRPCRKTWKNTRYSLASSIIHAC